MQRGSFIQLSILLSFALLTGFALHTHAQDSEVRKISGVRPTNLLPLDAEVFFNTPGFKDLPTTTIEDKMVELIGLAVPGSKIRMSIYQMSRVAVPKALIAASQRGVDVALVLDGGMLDLKETPGTGIFLLANGSPETGQLVCKSGSCLKFCHSPIKFRIHGMPFGGACNGTVINHNKFILFSKLSTGAENVVAQSSSNLENEQLHDYNDLVIVKNDQGLFNGFLAYWENLKRNHVRIVPFHDAVGDGNVVAKFFPRIITGDPVMQALKRVNCSLPNSHILVSEADINRLNFASLLRRLSDAGCDVKVITRLDPEMLSPIVGIPKRLGSHLMMIPFLEKNGDIALRNTIHTKLILIDASIDGSKEKRTLILTGSDNMDFFSLHTNDETILEIEDGALFNSYVKFWNRLRSDIINDHVKYFYGDELPLR